VFVWLVCGRCSCSLHGVCLTCWSVLQCVAVCVARCCCVSLCVCVARVQSQLLCVFDAWQFVAVCCGVRCGVCCCMLLCVAVCLRGSCAVTALVLSTVCF